MMALDNLKDIWKNQAESKIQFSETDIYKMIHKKSTSIVKWIYYISIIEFILFILPTFFLDTSEAESEFDITMFTRVLNIINFGIIMPIFIYLFYKNYKLICVNDTAKKLMQGILKTKKIVSFYVLSQLLIVAVLIFEIVYKISISETYLEQLPENMNMSIYWIIAILFTILTLFIVWLFYKLIYGILLNKLKINYKELQKQETEN